MAKKNASEAKQIADYLENQKAMQRAAEQVSSSLKGAAETYKDIRKLAASIAHVEREIVNLQKQENELLEIKKKNNGYLTREDAKQLKMLQQKIKYQKEDLEVYREKTKLLASQLNATNLIAGASRSLWKGFKANIQWFNEQDKAIKSSALNMGVLKSQSKGYWHNITKAAIQTNVLGSTAADLAKMQSEYSDGIGRMVILSEQGNIAMAEMANGTSLGAEGAAQMAASMDAFAVSVVGTRDRVQDTVDLAHKMGLNAGKVLKNLQQNLKIAQTYNFKNGVKGVIEMAAYSEKLKINMQSVAGFAAQVSNPEGAVEAAGTLQTLGGAWSQLADPFRLMYEARNDMEAFTKSIGEATAGTFRFNRQTGEIDKSSLELSRLREVAKATNIPFEELSEMALNMAKFKAIDLEINPTMKGDPAAKEFLESTATWSEKKKGFVVQIGVGPDSEKLISSLKQETINALISEKQTLASRAESSKSFDEQWTNIVNTFKTALLPFMKGIFDGLGSVMKKFTDWAKSGAFEKFAKTGQYIGEKIGWAIEQLAKSPILALGTILATWGGLKAATWLANGVMLGLGFNQTARVGGMGGMGGMGRGGMAGGMGGPSGKMTGADRAFARSQAFGSKANLGAGYSRLGMAKIGFGSNMGMGSRMGAGLALGAGGMMMKNSASQMDPDSGGAKALGIGGSAMTGAGIGMMAGPWGAAIGGLIGGLYGAITEFTKDPTIHGSVDQDTGQPLQDFIYRPGEGAVPFSKNDDLSVIGHKAGGPVENQIKSGGESTVKHTFGDINITGKLELSSSDGKTIDADMLKNNPSLVRALSRMIQTEIRAGSTGGKVNNSASTP